MANKRYTHYDTREVHWDDEEMQKRVNERRRKSISRRRRRKVLTLILVIAVFSVLATMCGKDIVRLKAENRALKKQQIALEQQRVELQEELRNANNQEYIREQAKKQLNLLNPGEILFTFDEEVPEEEAEPAKETEKTDKEKADKTDKEKSDKADKDKKDGGSDG